MSEEDIRDQKHLKYVREAREAVDEVSRGANVAFLMNPVRMEQVRDIAFSGEVLPQKSTDFYPKLLSGLTIYSLEEAAPPADQRRPLGCGDRALVRSHASLLLLALRAVRPYWLPHAIVLAQPTGLAALRVFPPGLLHRPTSQLNGQPYVGLVELLEPLGTVDARPDGKKLKLKFTPPGSRELELQFQDGKDKGKVKGDNIKLPANFAIQNGRGYIPLSAVSEVLARTLSQRKSG